MFSENSDIPPVEHGCAYLQDWLNRLADGDLTGLPRWYTHFHAANCRYCRVAVREIRALREVLRGLENDAPETVPGWDAPASINPDAAPLLSELSATRRETVLAAWQSASAQRLIGD